MDIFFTCNETYKHFLFTALYSILKNEKASNPLSFHILEEGSSGQLLLKTNFGSSSDRV